MQNLIFKNNDDNSFIYIYTIPYYAAAGIYYVLIVV